MSTSSSTTLITSLECRSTTSEDDLFFLPMSHFGLSVVGHSENYLTSGLYFDPSFMLQFTPSEEQTKVPTVSTTTS